MNSSTAILSPWDGTTAVPQRLFSHHGMAQQQLKWNRQQNRNACSPDENRIKNVGLETSYDALRPEAVPSYEARIISIIIILK